MWQRREQAYNGAVLEVKMRIPGQCRFGRAPNARAVVVALVAVALGILGCQHTTHDVPKDTAVIDHDLETLKALLASNAGINARDNEGKTPLHNAALNGQRRLAELLLANNADINAKDNEGKTPLHYAALDGPKYSWYPSLGNRADVAELLLANKADINAKDNEGKTPLHDAVVYGSAHVVELLLAKKPNVNAKDKNGDTPLAVLFRMSSDPGGEPLAFGKKQNVKLLLNAGARTDTQTKNRLLFRAAIDGDTEFAKLLLDVGANKNARWVESFACPGIGGGETPLILAAENGHADTVKLLLDAGADKEATDHSNCYSQGRSIGFPRLNYATPLIHAANEGHAEVVKVLLEAGANKNAKDYWGNTALTVAKDWHEIAPLRGDYSYVVNLLQATGPKK